MAGSIESMRRADPQYVNHLIHHGAARAEVALEVDLAKGGIGRWASASDEPSWTRDHLLGREDTDFYRERAYLAQATLGRLLEIYEKTGTSEASALTKFANDVLGLDALEALIDGLEETRDLRITKHLVPELVDVEGAIKSVKSVLEETSGRLRRLDEEAALLRSDLEQQKTLLAAYPAISLSNEKIDPLQSIEEVDEATRLTLARIQREIDSLRLRLDDVEGSRAGTDISEMEARFASATRASNSWRAEFGPILEAVMERLRIHFPDALTAEDIGPERAVAAALEVTDKALSRASNALDADSLFERQLEGVSQLVEGAIARLKLIDEQLETELSGAGELARLISELIPHIQQDVCPVCGRDFAEVSSEPLSVHASSNVAHLSSQAQRVLELTRERNAADLERSNGQDEIRNLKSRILTPSARSELMTSQGRLGQLQQELVQIAPAAKSAEQLFAEERHARIALNQIRRRVQEWAEVEEVSRELVNRVLSVTDRQDETLRETLERAKLEADSRIAVLDVRISLHRKIGELERSISLVSADAKDAREMRRGHSEELDALSEKRTAFDQSREIAKRVRSAAQTVQSDVVRRIFNESLNSVWRDLFVRLAPAEPFIPAFHVTGPPGHAIPKLVTHRRGGGLGGSPGTMLSSGNLNTAALTLFIALHLSSGDRLPLLVLDDPVQSMDDVHISQFAALLRTLSKHHGRQIVVAIHEPALFDYLTLELSPAFQGDTLITVELQKMRDGSTTVLPKLHQWREDPIGVAV
jgi:exonuclease SbcC